MTAFSEVVCSMKPSPANSRIWTFIPEYGSHGLTTHPLIEPLNDMANMRRVLYHLLMVSREADGNSVAQHCSISIMLIYDTFNIGIGTYHQDWKWCLFFTNL